MKKSKSLIFTTLLAFAMVFTMMFATMPNNIMSVFASGIEETTPTIVSIGANAVDQETNMGGAPTIVLGQPYSVQVNATGGNLVFGAGAGNFQKLPEGLTINSETGLISGTCTDIEMGRYNIYITATNNAGEAHAVIGVWVVDDSVNPEILTDAGTLGTIYTNSFAQFTVSVQSEANYLNDI
ncbi:MAG: hypothetical protein E7345_04710 [Clostridiales bacterium]|nr:hypothetical protein [Clostridiales bacterium]